ncbi:MAG: hypothetical protein Ta2G_03230 [Termitinemataceae bacterium]|nr:MAG: hypothetical protein Ta2G_03230 [Termitinemataceae bacterium]
MHIPLYGFSKTILSRLGSCKFGYWDERKNQFNLPSEYVTNALRAQLFYDIANVQVNESNGNINVNGFFGRVWHDESPKNTDFHSDPLFETLKIELHSRKYSPKTIKSYLYYNNDLCTTIKKAPVYVVQSDIKVYLAGLEQKGYSAASMNLAVSALKFFYGAILHRYFINEQRRPHQDKRLPKVLAQSEISALLASVKNLKHKLLLMLAYSSGLRVSELVALRIEDIDF